MARTSEKNDRGKVEIREYGASVAFLDLALVYANNLNSFIPPLACSFAFTN